MISQRGLRCGAERHLWASGLELAIYVKLCAVTWNKETRTYGIYYSSIQKLADYFGVTRQSASRAVNNLIAKGWLVVVEKNADRPKSASALLKEISQSSDLRIVTHAEWCKKHGEKNCAEELPMPWHDEIKDDLAIALHRESKGNAKFHPSWMAELRKSGKTDNEITQQFRLYIAALKYEPKNPRAWQRVASRFIYEFRSGVRRPASLLPATPEPAEKTPYTEAEEREITALFGMAS